MKKKKQRKVGGNGAKHSNQHHILFQGRYWKRGYARLLRNAFVREMDVDMHNSIHNRILRNVPRPDGRILAEAWSKYKLEEAEVDNLDFVGACDWLIANIDDLDFRIAIAKQRNFVALKGRR